jgi:hypothetical protein
MATIVAVIAMIAIAALGWPQVAGVLTFEVVQLRWRSVGVI